MPAMIEVENINHPGQTVRREAAKYLAARKAFLGFLPRSAPGVTQEEMFRAMRQALPEDQFPGKTTSWWMKTVQLDLEAKGLVVRDQGKPLRWRQV